MCASVKAALLILGYSRCCAPLADEFEKKRSSFFMGVRRTLRFKSRKPSKPARWCLVVRRGDPLVAVAMHAVIVFECSMQCASPSHAYNSQHHVRACAPLIGVAPRVGLL